MNLKQVINTTVRFSVSAAISYGVGYLYGAIFNANKTVAARAFAISNLVTNIFNLYVNRVTGGQLSNPLDFHATQLVGTLVLSVIQILAFRRLNLIANFGTVVFSGLLALVTVYHLNEMGHASLHKTFS